MIYSPASPAKAALEEYLFPIAGVLDRTPLTPDGLLMGNLGKALYYCYLARHTGSPGHAAAGNRLVEEIFGRVLDGTSRLWRRNSLTSGMAGFGWALTALAEDGLLDDYFSGFLEKVERRMAQEMPAMIADNDLDFMHSSVGMLAYLIERTGAHGALVPQVEAWIAALAEKLEAHPAGGAFLRNEYFLKKTKFGPSVDPSDVNLRLPHGLSGILLVLLKAYERDIARPAVRHIVEQGVAYLLTTMQPEHPDDGREHVFPSNVFVALPPGHERNRSMYRLRLAWCYGDLNQALLLYRAGQCLGHPAWVAIADRVGLATLRKKSYQDTLIGDVSLCHGSAGAARFYEALYRLSGQAAYREGYDYWNEKLAGQLAGIFAHNRLPDNPASLLEGLSGAGLAALAHLDGRPGSWEKFFLFY